MHYKHPQINTYNAAEAYPCDETWVQWGDGCGSTVAGWLAGWPVRLHWNAGSFVCPREEWVRGRMPLMIAERKNEPPGSVLSLCPLPHSPTLILSPSFSIFFCVWEPSPCWASLSEATVPRHNHCFVLPCEHTPLLYWAPTFARAKETQGHCSYSYPHRCSCMDGVCASALNGKLFFMWHTHQYKHLVYRCFVTSKSFIILCLAQRTIIYKHPIKLPD